AFGIDWLNERWLKGNPPTYQEFAYYWIKETERRRQQGEPPKQEWALIRFMQKMKVEYPNASKEELIHAWKTKQSKKSQQAQQLIHQAKSKLENNIHTVF
ncbi:unnamed protein product, partial [marine sediment metagenome]